MKKPEVENLVALSLKIHVGKVKRIDTTWVHCGNAAAYTMRDFNDDCRFYKIPAPGISRSSQLSSSCQGGCYRSITV